MEFIHRRTIGAVVVSAVVHLLVISLLLLWWLPSTRKPPVQVLMASPVFVSELVIFELPTISITEAEVEPPMILPMAAAVPIIPHPSKRTIDGEHDSDQLAGSVGTQAGLPGGKPAATFFGSVASGNHLVYVVDASTSMNEGGGRRFDRALTELLRSIDGLRHDQYFYVLFFSSKTRRLFDETTPPRWLPATDDNKRKLRGWVAKVEPSGGTHPQEALYLASQLQPSAVFLLSDGDFSNATRRYRGTITGKSPIQVVKESPWDNIPIHTIALENRAGEYKLQGLSELTGGDYRYVKGPLEFYRLEYQNVWQNYDTFPRTPEVRHQLQALELLMKGDRDALRRRPESAMRSYQTILREFASTQAAAIARRRVHNPGVSE